MKDKLSTLFDGSLDEQAVGSVLDALRRDAGAREDWKAWCVVGDVLRGDGAGSPAFVDRVMAEIDREPVVLVPAAAATRAAQRSMWRTVMPLAASLMGVAVVGWVAHTLSAGDGRVVEVARVAPAVAPVERVAVSLPAAPFADPHREYVFVHQAMSGGPLPAAVQYVRTVSDLRQEGGR